MGVETELFGLKNRWDGKEFRVIERADGSIAVLAGEKVLVDSGVTPVTAVPSGSGGDSGTPGLVYPSLTGAVGRSASSIHFPPTAFAWPATLPSIFAIRHGDRFYCNVGPEDLIDTSGYTRTYYVDVVGGLDTNTGLTYAQRVQSIGKAIDLAIAAAVPSRILVSEGVYPRNRAITQSSAAKVLTAPITIERVGGRVQTGTFDALTWTLSAAQTYTYEATRSGALRVFNPSVKTAQGLYTEYTWRTSIANVEANPGSWYTDGTKVYVRPHVTNGVPNLDVARVYISDIGQGLRGNFNVLLRGIDMEGGTTGPFNFASGVNNRVVLDNCTMRYSAKSNTYNGGSTVIDGAQILDCGLFAAFNSSCDLNSKDGFNFHAANGVIPSVLLVGCAGFGNGLSPSTSNNGFTCHDGVKAISIGGDWRGSYGTNSGHVSTATQVWAVGDIAGASLGDVPLGGTINWAGFGTWQSTPADGAGTMWLDSCQDVGCDIGVYTDTGNGAAIYLRNHRGAGQRVGTIQTY